MNNEQLQMIFDKLDQIGSKLGESAETIWPWFIKQQYIDGYYSLVVFILLPIILFFTLRYSIKRITKDNDDGFAVMGFVISFFLSMPFIVLLINIGCILSQILNPEYSALKDLLRMVR